MVGVGVEVVVVVGVEVVVVVEVVVEVGVEVEVEVEVGIRPPGLPGRRTVRRRMKKPGRTLSRAAGPNQPRSPDASLRGDRNAAA